jgi:hypothetical protein
LFICIAPWLLSGERIERHSHGGGSFARHVKCSLDSETLTPEQKTDLERAARGSVDFLPRRHLECYLINAASIADFIAHRYKKASCDASVPTEKEVETALKNIDGFTSSLLEGKELPTINFKCDKINTWIS